MAISDEAAKVSEAVAQEPEDVSERPPLEPTVDSAPKFWRLTPVNFLLWGAYLAAAALIIFGPHSLLWWAPAIAGVALIVDRSLYSRRAIPVTLRKSIRRLPVLRDPGVQRIGALMGVAGTTCGRCVHFDLATGQKMLTGTNFGIAAQMLAPNQMLKTKRGAWTKENGFDERGQPLNEDVDTKWSELGACTLKNIGVFAPHSCKDWS